MARRGGHNLFRTFGSPDARPVRVPGSRSGDQGHARILLNKPLVKLNFELFLEYDLGLRGAIIPLAALYPGEGQVCSQSAAKLMGSCAFPTLARTNR